MFSLRLFVGLSGRLNKNHPTDFYEVWIGHGSQLE